MACKLLAEGLSVGYDGKALIRNLSFAVGSGECVLLCGGNGMGKSTLLRTLAGLQKPLGGTVRNPGGGKAAAQTGRQRGGLGGQHPDNESALGILPRAVHP